MQREKARNKYCPLNTIAHAASADGDIGCYCDVDACMLWRWKNEEESDGYCGLAGREDVEP